MKINSEQEMMEAGRTFAEEVNGVVELVGDVGVGKTTFARGLAEGLRIKGPITSPSFTISKAYACPGGKTLIHYDFYRLNDPGIMSEDLLENLKNSDNIILIEWSDSIKDILPEKHTIINIKYNDDNSRELEILK